MRERQRRDFVRNLLGSKMPKCPAGLRIDMAQRQILPCPLLLRGRPYRNGITPNEQGGHSYDTERCADRAARTIPGERCLHCGHVAEHRNMQRNRRWWDVVRFQPRWLGATPRYPAAASAGICPRHIWNDLAKPWRAAPRVRPRALAVFM